MNYEDILKIICDSLRYPEFVKAFENLNQFEQKELCQDIESVLQRIYNDGYEESEEESENAFDEGYEEGKAYGEELGLKNALEIVVEKEKQWFNAKDAIEETITAIENRIDDITREQEDEN